jgi:hypothetical protein
MEINHLEKFGPCGLLCEKCFAFKNGPIHFHAEMLKTNLGEFDIYARRFVELLDDPVFAEYPDFKIFLNTLAKGNCLGCRKQECHLFTACKIKDCYKNKNVEYCFQCEAFPCENTGFDDNLKQRWLKINLRIREIGLENYYSEVKDKPRY